MKRDAEFGSREQVHSKKAVLNYPYPRYKNLQIYIYIYIWAETEHMLDDGGIFLICHIKLSAHRVHTGMSDSNLMLF